MHHNKALDGLRGWAALSVAVLHFVIAFVPLLADGLYAPSSSKDTLSRILSFPFMQLPYNGDLAVMIFFVLSGYVIALPFYNNDIEKLKRRLWARYLRLNIPVFMAVLFSFSLYSFGLYYGVQASSAGAAEWLQRVFPQSDGYSFTDALMVAIYRGVFYGDKTYVYTLWSLYFEFLGSILLLVFYIVRPRARVVPISIAAILLLWLSFGKNSIYLLAIYVGSLLPYFIPKGQYSHMICLLSGIYFGSFIQGYVIYDVLPEPSILGYKMFNPCQFYKGIGAAMIVAAVLNGAGERIFAARVSQFLGEISFSLYLLHFPILLSFSCFIFTVLPNNALSITLNFFLYLLCVVSVSYAFAITVDRRAISMSRKAAAWVFACSSPCGKPDFELRSEGEISILTFLTQDENRLADPVRTSRPLRDAVKD